MLKFTLVVALALIPNVVWANSPCNLQVEMYSAISAALEAEHNQGIDPWYTGDENNCGPNTISVMFQASRIGNAQWSDLVTFKNCQPVSVSLGKYCDAPGTP